MAKLVKCCDELLDDYNNISITVSGKVAYWTGEELGARDVEIKYCPFCGKKIRVEE